MADGVLIRIEHAAETLRMGLLQFFPVGGRRTFNTAAENIQYPYHFKVRKLPLYLSLELDASKDRCIIKCNAKIIGNLLKNGPSRITLANGLKSTNFKLVYNRNAL